MTRIAQLPTQKMKETDYQFEGQVHPRLPIRSLDEDCSSAEKYRRWVNDRPTRGSEKINEMNHWINHYQAAKEVPIHTITLDINSLDVTRWWRNFFVELGVLDEEDRVFKDLSCSRPKRGR